ncbi:MAG: SoxR reducing system RseC family protein [Wenzhouxiangellaceae bacterium]|nr:SoxR reducing system RseC family protein [Wenzhouxiangellaceae bacterium]
MTATHPTAASARIWQPALLVRDGDGQWWLEFPPAGQCARCARGEGCGAGLFARLLAPMRVTRLAVHNRANWPDGTPVMAGIAGRWLLVAAAGLYLLPLLLFVAGAVLADGFWPGSDSLALIVGLAFGLAGLSAVRTRLRRIPAPEMRRRATACALESRDGGNHVDSRDDGGAQLQRRPDFDPFNPQ